MSERTIGGRDIKTVLEELRAEFPKEVIKVHDVTKKLYIPASLVHERFDKVIGLENWSFVLTSPPQIVKLGPDNYESCVVSARIEIYEDNGHVMKRDAAGAADLIYPKPRKKASAEESGEKEKIRPTSVANVVDTATQDAFKRCAKRFGVGLKEAGVNNEGKKLQLFKVNVLGPFISLSGGGAKAKVQYEKKQVDFIIWKSQWEAIQKQYGTDKFRIGVKLANIEFYGNVQQFRGADQLIFDSFPKRGAA